MSLSLGKLWFAATPIGNYDDVSLRFKAIIAKADIIAAEDTRRVLNLLDAIEVNYVGKIISFYDHNEAERITGIITAVKEGKQVIVVSDAGMPLVNDPGYGLVQAAIKAGIDFSCLPGPSAVLTALIMSGLPTDRFCFEGFIPRKTGERNKLFQSLSMEARTMIFFETPKRINAAVKEAINYFGAERVAVLCRELTKTHEEIIRGTLAEIWEITKTEVKGELVLLIGGFTGEKYTKITAVSMVKELIAQGIKTKVACKQVAEITGFSANNLYAEIVN